MIDGGQWGEVVEVRIDEVGTATCGIDGRTGRFWTASSFRSWMDGGMERMELLHWVSNVL